MFWELVSWFGELYFFLLVIGFFVWYGRKKEAIGMTCLLVLESALVLGMKTFFKQARPSGATQESYAFPSGHSSKAGAIAGFVVDRKTLPILLLPVLVGASRVFLGEHSWVDVIAGISFGLLIGFLFSKLWGRLPVMSFGRHHKFAFSVLSVVAFIVAASVGFAYVNYVAAVAGLIVGFLVVSEKEKGQKVVVSGVLGFVILTAFIYITSGYWNFMLNFVLGLWISALNASVWEALRKLS